MLHIDFQFPPDFVEFLLLCVIARVWQNWAVLSEPLHQSQEAEQLPVFILISFVFVQVYATGYGHGGRLGLGGTETVTSVRLIESLQHVVIKKVSVHSGGKHAMALSQDGDVYSWGEGDDGKLGHGNRK